MKRDIKKLDEAIKSYWRLEEKAVTDNSKQHYRQRRLWLQELKRLWERGKSA